MNASRYGLSDAERSLYPPFEKSPFGQDTPLGNQIYRGSKYDTTSASDVAQQALTGGGSAGISDVGEAGAVSTFGTATTATTDTGSLSGDLSLGSVGGTVVATPAAVTAASDAGFAIGGALGGSASFGGGDSTAVTTTDTTAAATTTDTAAAAPSYAASTDVTFGATIGGSGATGGDYGGGGDLGSVPASDSAGTDFSGGSTMATGVFHDGGVAGSASRSRIVPSGIFSGAPRYHNGGLAADEVPVIAQKGERILNPAETQQYDARSQSGNTGRIVNITQNIMTPDANSFRATAGQTMAATATAADRSHRNN